MVLQRLRTTHFRALEDISNFERDSRFLHLQDLPIMQLKHLASLAAWRAIV